LRISSITFSSASVSARGVDDVAATAAGVAAGAAEGIAAGRGADAFFAMRLRAIGLGFGSGI